MYVHVYVFISIYIRYGPAWHCCYTRHFSPSNISSITSYLSLTRDGALVNSEGGGSQGFLYTTLFARSLSRLYFVKHTFLLILVGSNIPRNRKGSQRARSREPRTCSLLGCWRGRNMGGDGEENTLPIHTKLNLTYFTLLYQILSRKTHRVNPH